MKFTYLFSKEFESVEAAESYLKTSPITFFQNASETTVCFMNVNKALHVSVYSADKEDIMIVPYFANRAKCQILPTNEKGELGAITKNSSLRLNDNLLQFAQNVDKKSVQQHFEDVKADATERKRLGYSEIEKYVLLNFS